MFEFLDHTPSKQSGNVDRLRALCASCSYATPNCDDSPLAAEVLISPPREATRIPRVADLMGREQVPRAGFYCGCIRIAIVVLSNFAAMGIASAQAKAERDIAICLNQKRNLAPVIVIAACTRLIDTKGVTPPSLPKIYFHRGLAYANGGNTARALAEYSKAIPLNPAYAAAYNNRGAIYKDRKEYDRAVADFSRAIGINGPHTVQALLNRASTLQIQGKVAKALADVDKATMINPKFALAYTFRGYFHQESGNFDQALRDHDRAISLDPMLVLAYKNRAYMHRLQGNYDRAIPDLTKALRLAPKDAPALEELCHTLGLMGNIDRAVEECSEAIKYSHNKARSYSIRGILLAAQGNVRLAIADY